MKTPIFAFAVLFSSLCFAASPVIGVVARAGAGESNLTEGSAVSATATPNDVRLERGVSLRLAAHSSGVFYGDHALLENGAAKLSRFKGYALDAGSLRIESESEAAEAIVRMDQQTIEIASLGGPVSVREGAMLTRVESGTKMAFQNSGATSGQPASGKRPVSRTKILVWTMVGIAAAAAAIGGLAIAQGKSL